MNAFVSTRPHIIAKQKKEARRAKIAGAFVLFGKGVIVLLVTAVCYVTLVGLLLI